MEVKLLMSFVLLTWFHARGQSPLMRVSFEISSIENKKGELFLALFRQGSAFPEQTGRFAGKIVAVEGKTNLQVDFDLPEGQYAAALFQDLNGNQQLDRNFLGIPKEPFAFSNNVRPKLSAPTFEQCQFAVRKEPVKMKIEMIN